MNRIVELKNVNKKFDHGVITALSDVSLQIERGSFVAIMGPSGCGKSTLLNVIASLDKADSGVVRVNGLDYATYKHDLSKFRKSNIGFIFQHHNLIPTLNILENVQLPMFGTPLAARARVEKATILLTEVGLESRLESLPTQLSGGERQRAAIARSLANDPVLLIADEPTGSLDTKSSDAAMHLMVKLNKEHNTTIVMVTHNLEIAKFADKIILMSNGSIV